MAKGSAILPIEPVHQVFQSIPIIGLKNLPDPGLEIGQAGFENDLLDFGQVRWVHGEFAQAKSQQ